MSPTLIPFHLDHFSLPSLHVCKFPLLLSAVYFLKCSTPTYLHSTMRIAIQYSCGKQLYQLEYSAYVQFPLPSLHSTDFTYFQSYISQHLSCTPPSWSCFIHNHIRFSCHSLHSFLESPNILNYFYFNLHTIMFTLCAIKCYTCSQIHVMYPSLWNHTGSYMT